MEYQKRQTCSIQCVQCYNKNHGCQLHKIQEKQPNAVVREIKIYFAELLQNLLSKWEFFSNLA